MKAATVVLQWIFTPPDYFEQSITVSRNDYTLVIGDGKAKATIVAQVFDATPAMRNSLHEELKARFLAVQLISHRPFELSKPTMVRVRQDGTEEDIFVELESEVLSISGYSLDAQITEKGNIVSDSRRDRIDRKKSLADLVSSYSRDELLTALLTSHKNSVRDPDNELVHLFEIREALAEKFGKDTRTRTVLGVSLNDWRRFGLLCNDAPLRQGRHRGRNVGVLRDATHSELEEARRIAVSMVEAYVRRL